MWVTWTGHVTFPSLLHNPMFYLLVTEHLINAIAVGIDSFLEEGMSSRRLSLSRHLGCDHAVAVCVWQLPGAVASDGTGDPWPRVPSASPVL